MRSLPVGFPGWASPVPHGASPALTHGGAGAGSGAVTALTPERRHTDLREESASDQSKAERVREMFAGIAPRYDLLNTVLSLGADRFWRHEAATVALAAGASEVLDVATGTGDLALTLKKLSPQARVVGVDFTEPMLEVARRKAEERRLELDWILADALSLPFEDRSFDAVTIAYGLRNLSDLEAGIREFRRVLKPGGRLVIVEFPPPTDDVLGRLFRAYFLNVLPRVGGWISGSRSAYEYLPASVLAFPRPPELSALVRDVGFSRVRYRLQSHGVSAIFVGEKT